MRSGSLPPARLTDHQSRAAIRSNAVASRLQSRKFAGETLSFVLSPTSAPVSDTIARWSRSRTEMGLRMSASTTSKITALAPRPSARVSTTSALKAGRLRSDRTAYRKSRAIVRISGSPCLGCVRVLGCARRARRRATPYRAPIDAACIQYHALAADAASGLPDDARAMYSSWRSPSTASRQSPAPMMAPSRRAARRGGFMIVRGWTRALSRGARAQRAQSAARSILPV